MDKENQTDLHQYNFIRRAELIIVFIIKDQNVNSVVGTFYVSKHREDIDNYGYFDIAGGTDYENTERYWNKVSDSMKDLIKVFSLPLKKELSVVLQPIIERYDYAFKFSYIEQTVKQIEIDW